MKIKLIVPKTVIYALAAVAVLASGCTSMLEDRDFAVDSFKGGECLGTRASYADTSYAKVGKLHLKYSDGNLKITLSGMQDNCSITEGFDCNAMIEGSILYIDVVAKSPNIANCTCNVSDIVTEVSGLEKREYTLVYNYRSSTKDITEKVMFNFSPVLNKKVDVNVMMISVYSD